MIKSLLISISNCLGILKDTDVSWRIMLKMWSNWLRRHPQWPSTPIAIGSAFLPSSWILALLAGSFLSSVISVSSIIAGFLTMGISVLLALGGKRIMRLLDSLSLREEIYRSVWLAARWMLFSAGVCMFSLLVKGIGGVDQQGRYICTWICRVLASAIVFYVLCAFCYGWTAFKNITAIVDRHVELDTQEEKST